MSLKPVQVGLSGMTDIESRHSQVIMFRTFITRLYLVTIDIGYYSTEVDFSFKKGYLSNMKLVYMEDTCKNMIIKRRSRGEY